MYEQPDVDSAWNAWKVIFLRICDKHAPYKNMTVRGETTPWVTDDYISFAQERDYFKRKAESTGDPDIWHKYRTVRNYVNNLREHLRKEHYANVIFENQNSPGKLWKVMKQMMGTSKSCKTSIKGLASGDKFVSNTKEIVNVFNTFFTNVGKNLAVKFKYVCTSIKQDRNVVENSQKFNSVTPNNVCKQIHSLCFAKATGSDKISARLLKTAAPQISDSLCYVINLSLKSGAVPKEWKHARVILYKDGKCDEASNYRPISVLPIISKIMERILHDQLYKCIE